MKFKAFSSLIAASTILVSVLPAKAQYFPTWDQVSSGSNNNSHCSDVGLGNDVQKNTGFSQGGSKSSSSSLNQGYNSSQSSSSRNGSGGGGLSLPIKGVPISLSGQQRKSSQNSNKSNSGFRREYNNTFESNTNTGYDRGSSTVVKGKNCDGFYDAAAQVQSTQIISDVEEKRIESNSQTDLFKTLMQGW